MLQADKGSMITEEEKNWTYIAIKARQRWDCAPIKRLSSTVQWLSMLENGCPFSPRTKLWHFLLQLHKALLNLHHSLKSTRIRYYGLHLRRLHLQWQMKYTNTRALPTGHPEEVLYKCHATLHYLKLYYKIYRIS